MVSAWFPLILIALLYLLVHLPHLNLSLSIVKPISRPQQHSPGQLIFHSQHGAAALLPLQFSDPNLTFSNNFDVRHGRQLGGSARMTLHDDLLTKGYYTSRVWIGTPAQEFALIVDTGSTVTYVPCSSCTHCGSHQDPRFAPDSSSSYQPLNCKTECVTNQCDTKQQCKYERQYAEMSTSSGLLGKDIMSFGNNSMIGEEHLTFGCETIETGDLFYQDADGIMGLGRGPLSIVDQLVEHKAMSNSFSLCYGGMDEGGGAMILGAIPPPPEMVFTASEPHRSPYYNLGLKGLRVADNPLSIDPSVFNGRFGTILDSGTTYAYFPEKAYNVFRDAVKQQLGKLQEVAGPDPNFPDVCFAGAGNDPIDLPKHFPSVDLVFEAGEVVSLAPENYLFRHTRVPGAYCLGIFKNGKDPTTLLGGIVVRNMLVTYDRANDKIGFWKTKCTDLWMNLPAVVPPSGAEPIKDPNGISPSPERLPPSSGPKETPGTPPSQYVPVPAPEQGAAERWSKHFKAMCLFVSILFRQNFTSWLWECYKLNLETITQRFLTHQAHYVGGIEVQMILSTNYSIFSTLTSEFLEEIAHELDVNRSQVSIVKYKDQGRNVSVLWRILPAATENQIMETTAQSIISRLQGHEIHLGGHFGMYELTSWKMIPTSTRSWLSHWHLVVIAAIAASAIAVIAVGLLVYWHLWRYRDKGRSKYVHLQTLGDEESLEQL